MLTNTTANDDRPQSDRATGDRTDTEQRYLPIGLFVTPTDDASGDHDLYIHLIDRDYRIARLYDFLPLTGAGCLLAELLCGRVNFGVAQAFEVRPALWQLFDALEALLPDVLDPKESVPARSDPTGSATGTPAA